MSTLEILLEQIGLFIIYIAVGYALIRTKVFNKDTIEILAKFVMKLALPVMIFTNTVNCISREELIQSLPMFLGTIAMYALLFGISRILTKVFRMQGDRAQIFSALCLFGNVGFMGIPIVSSIFPERGMLYIAALTVVDQLTLWTVGVKLTTPSGMGKFNPKKMINPATVAITLAVIMVFIGVKPPTLLNSALTKIGGCSTPMAMIYLGGVFACMSISGYLKNWEYYSIILVKMILFPVCFYMLLGYTPIPEEIRMTIALISGMPGMTSIVMMAKASGSEGDYAMGGIFITTLGSILTLPFVCWIIQTFL